MASTNVFNAFNGRRGAQRDLIRVDSRPAEAGSERRTWTTNPSASLKRDGPDGTVIWTPGNIFQSDDRHSPT